ncbi:ParB/RepB/Spo0J family partition protein [Streptomyces atratus]|uniref:ParB/RepB/Spo0J family partition protein n=1 Tax=Streptomyces atratus TaxID=1893 RepID=UPI002F9098B1
MNIAVESILVGERDRTDPGDLSDLKASIAAVGLLHPIVVTENHELIAGGRRLAAIRELGWTDTPVTVVDLTTAADALRAEADENTCRKALTPYEAARARERRTRLLAPAAKGRKEQAIRERDSSGRAVATSANLAEVAPPAARETRKVAALGTGYSGSTLDKVDRIRDVAERGVIRQGKTETPAPEPVRAAARQALEEVKKTGAAVEPASRQVETAIAEYVEADPGVQDARLAREVFRLIVQTNSGLPKLDAARVRALRNKEMHEALADAYERLGQWVREASGEQEQERGLRVIRGTA